MNPEQLEREVREFLRDVLGVEESELQRESELVSSGLVDSAGIVRLAAQLERTLGITIPDLDVNVDHFDSIARIVAYVEVRLGA